MNDITILTQVRQIRNILLKTPELASIFEVMIILSNFVLNNQNSKELLDMIHELLSDSEDE